MKNSLRLTTIALLMAVSSLSAATHYVSLESTNPTPPYTNWATAAASIQDAIDAATAEDQVLVTNGVYAVGGRPTQGAGELPNRVAVDRPVLLQSVNGPLFTSIQGNLPLGNSAVRCVYLTNGATISGFTLTRGGTMTSWNVSVWDMYGGGVLCAPTGAVVSNCVFTGNSAIMGGGAIWGTLINCTLTGNSASKGGGAYYATLYNCTLSGNSAGDWGGAAYNSTLFNSTLSGNSAVNLGGGEAFSTLYNCTLTGNSAADGGGAYFGTLNNSIVYFNNAPNGANYDTSCTLNYCCTMPLPASGTGNLTIDPQLASSSHLSACSPCRGAGSIAYATGTDIDGEPWDSPPSIGCDEYDAGAVTGSLSVAILAPYTNLTVGFAVGLTAVIKGRTVASVWDLGDGLVVSNWPWATHAWRSAGNYTVALRAYNEDHPEGIGCNLAISVTQMVHYVSATSAGPAYPYTSWGTAAQTIQTAVDAAWISRGSGARNQWCVFFRWSSGWNEPPG